jgi:putative sterol carrier protein
MPKFMSEEYFGEIQSVLSQDQKWQDTTKGLKTSILLTVADTGSSHLINIENGLTAIQKVDQSAQAEFTLEGGYDLWAKIAKGEVDLQTAVLKGQLRFKGSITKILMYRDRFMRIAEVMKMVPKEF